ncbi:hypothetical protein T01_14268 [Trichinella spiralis]|uniref:Uncharacterized protein n=1 Tax=Trichinella spiralis TaxID=6334 RepID=A0A0V1AID4_TRISP|nr:hypothetical protein T01_14268 [Trichinella spiralis]
MSSHEARTDVNLAFQWRFLAVPQWITSSENLFSRSRWHSQIAFPTVLMFFLVTQVRNCEDESRILNDLHRIS